MAPFINRTEQKAGDFSSEQVAAKRAIQESVRESNRFILSQRSEVSRTRPYELDIERKGMYKVRKLSEK